MSALPARTALRWAPADALESHEPVGDAADRILGQRHASAARRRSWVTHPDERVPVLLLTRDRDHPLWQGRLARQMRDDLVRRAVADAEREGVGWTPLLDELMAGPWPLTAEQREAISAPLGVLADALAETGEPGPIRPLFAFRSHRLRQAVAEHAAGLDVPMIDRLLRDPRVGVALARNDALMGCARERLHRWLAASVERLRSLPGDRLHTNRRAGSLMSAVAMTVGELHRRGRSGPVRPVVTDLGRLAARYASDPRSLERPFRMAAREALRIESLDPDLLAGLAPHLVGTSSLHRLLDHPAANEEVCRRVGEIADDRVTHEALADREPVPGGALWRLLLESSHITVLMALLEQAGELAHRRQIAGRIIDLLPEGSWETMLQEGPYDASGLMGRLLDVEALTPEQLRALFLKVKHVASWARRITQHPSADASVWRFMLDRTRSSDTRQSVASCDRAVAVEAVRERLLRTGDGAVLRLLLWRVDKEAFRSVFRALLEADPERAGTVFCAREDDDRWAVLGPAELKPLLRSADADVRSRALTLLARSGAGEDAQSSSSNAARVTAPSP